MAPDGRDWAYGCQRDDWTLGPDSRIVEPVGLLDPEQRQELEHVLRTACCWPPPDIAPDLVFPIETGETSDRRRRRRTAQRHPARPCAGPGLRSRG